jgi:hypothetical protein
MNLGRNEGQGRIGLRAGLAAVVTADRVGRLARARV